MASAPRRHSHRSFREGRLPGKGLWTGGHSSSAFHPTAKWPDESCPSFHLQPLLCIHPLLTPTATTSVQRSLPGANYRESCVERIVKLKEKVSLPLTDSVQVKCSSFKSFISHNDPRDLSVPSLPVICPYPPGKH